MLAPNIRILEDLSYVQGEGWNFIISPFLLYLGIVGFVAVLLLLAYAARHDYHAWLVKTNFIKVKKVDLITPECIESLNRYVDSLQPWFAKSINIQTTLLALICVIGLMMSILAICLGFHNDEETQLIHSYKIEVSGDVPQEILDNWDLDNWEDGTCVITEKVEEEGE